MTGTTARLAEPVSAEAPCGVDLADEPVLYEIRQMAQGRPATQFSAEEEPDWATLRALCEQTLARSKHLSVVVPYLLSLVATEGLEGEAEGLEFLRALLERYWSQLFPALDSSDGNDPTERMHILENLTIPIGAYEDPIRFVARVRRIPLLMVPHVGPVSVESVTGTNPGTGGNPALSRGQLDAILIGLPPAQLGSQKALVQRSVEALHGIEKFLQDSVGIEKAPSWENLMEALQQQARIFDDGAKAGGTSSSQRDGGTAVFENEGPNRPNVERFGSIQSREDAVRAIGAICEYYRHNEPSSPVPFLLRRAEGLVNKNFLDVVADLAPGATDSVRSVTGPSGE